MLKCMAGNQLELDGVMSSCMTISVKMTADIFLSLVFILCSFSVGLQDAPGAIVLGTGARSGSVELGRSNETWNVPFNFQFGHKVKDISCIN